MSTLKSSAEDLTLNADGSRNDIILQSNGSTKAIVTAEGTAGIGTATPNKTLDVTSTAGSAGTPNGLYLYNTIHGSDSQIYMYAENDSGTLKGASIKLDPDAETLSLGYSATAISIDSTGAVTKPLQPAFLATFSGDQLNIALDTYTTLLFNTEIFDQNADFNTGTYTFTAPVTGKYQLNAMIRYEAMDNDHSVMYLEIKTSNRIFYTLISAEGFDQDVGQWARTMSILADMDASDTAYIRVNHSGGGATTDLATTNYFSGHLVC